MTFVLKGTRGGMTVISRQKGKRLITGGVTIPYPVSAFMQGILSQTDSAAALAALGAPDAQSTSSSKRLGFVSVSASTTWLEAFNIGNGYFNIAGASDGPVALGANWFMGSNLRHSSPSLWGRQEGYGFSIAAPNDTKSYDRLFLNGSVVVNGFTDSQGWYRTLRSKAECDALYATKPVICTVATAPSASGLGASAEIFVTNEIGGATPAFSDGTNWRRVHDRAIIS